MTTSPAAEPEFDLVVTRKEVLATDVAQLTLVRSDGDELPPWEAGAHIDLVLDNGLVRQYSLCGEPASRSELRVAVLREQSGRGGSQYVHEKLEVGQHVRIRGPRNHFNLVDADQYIFIAGGIGITPILPMIRAVASRGADWRLVYGGRALASMAFRSELQEIDSERVHFVPADTSGIIDVAQTLGSAAGGDVAVYCCGPGPLLDAVEGRCRELAGFTAHVERFMPKSDLLEGGVDRSFTVELAQSKLTLAVPVDCSILEVVEDAGINIPSSCLEGVCGSCETKVLAGKPDHRDSVLSAEQQESASTMMICCSRSCSDRLVLDL